MSRGRRRPRPDVPVRRDEDELHVAFLAKKAAAFLEYPLSLQLVDLARNASQEAQSRSSAAGRRTK